MSAVTNATSGDIASHRGASALRATPAHPFLLRREAAALVSLIVLVTLTWLPRFHGPIDVRWDGGVYYILGTSLAQGKGYRLLNEPGEIHAVQYPPVLPLIVAAHQRVLGTSDVAVVGPWLRGFNLLMTMGLVVGAYALARVYLPRPYALLAAVVCALCRHTLFLSDALYPEILFAVVTILFFLVNRKRPLLGATVTCGLLGATAYLLRTAGVALLAAWIVESLIERRYKQAALRTILALIPILGWQSYLSVVKNGPEYCQPAYAYQRAPYQFYNVTYVENLRLVDSFAPERGSLSAKGLLKRVVANLVSMPAVLGEAVAAQADHLQSPLRRVNERVGRTILPPALVYPPLVLLGCLVIAGMALLAARGEWLAPLFFAGSATLICLTPWPGQFLRYLMPLTPVLAVAIFYAVSAVARGIAERFPRRRRFGTGFAVGLALTIVAGQIVSLVITYRSREAPVPFHGSGPNDGPAVSLFYYNQAYRTLDSSLEWLRVHARPGAIVATTAPHTAYLRTNLQAVMPPMEADTARAQRLLDSVPAQYLVLDNLPYINTSQHYAAPVVAHNPGRWRCVFTASHGDSRVYERVP